jgi:hypothetical protein
MDDFWYIEKYGVHYPVDWYDDSYEDYIDYIIPDSIDGILDDEEDDDEY